MNVPTSISLPPAFRKTSSLFPGQSVTDTHTIVSQGKHIQDTLPWTALHFTLQILQRTLSVLSF